MMSARPIANNPKNSQDFDTFRGEKTVSSHAVIHLHCSQFELPPIRDAVLVGRRAPVGAKALFQALEDMTPGLYELIQTDHPVIEAIIIRRSETRKIPKEKLIPLLLKRIAPFMDETDALRVEIDITLVLSETVDLP